MVVDALLAANPILDISGRISNPERYLYLTDSVLEEIECSTDPRLTPAREIILRIRRRDLYRCVDYLHVGVSDKAALEKVLTEEKVAREANAIRLDIEGSEDGESAREVRDSDVIIDWAYLHYGMREQDPIEQVLFYGKGNANSELFKYGFAPRLTLICYAWNRRGIQSGQDAVFAVCSNGICRIRIASVYARWVVSLRFNVLSDLYLTLFDVPVACTA